MSEYNIYDGAPCPVPACDGHLKVSNETTIETAGGLTRLVRKRVGEGNGSQVMTHRQRAALLSTAEPARRYDDTSEEATKIARILLTLAQAARNRKPKGFVP